MRKSTTLLLTALSILGCTGVAGAYAAHAAEAARPGPKSDAYREFTDSCIEAFSASHHRAAEGRDDVEPGESERAARQMCECTAKESRHEKVPAAALRREAARIRENPKYEIKHQGLLNSFHYCTVQAMHEMEAAEKR